jgi:uncharacterized Tic20 family protein
MDDPTQRKAVSALCHGAIFFSSTIISIGIPIAVLLLTEDSVVKENAKESLNFYMNLYLYAIIFALLLLVAIGFPLLILLLLASFVIPIIAIIKVLDVPDRPYHYPFIFRLF